MVTDRELNNGEAPSSPTPAEQVPREAGEHTAPEPRAAPSPPAAPGPQPAPPWGRIPASDPFTRPPEPAGPRPDSHPTPGAAHPTSADRPGPPLGAPPGAHRADPPPEQTGPPPAGSEEVTQEYPRRDFGPPPMRDAEAAPHRYSGQQSDPGGRPGAPDTAPRPWGAQPPRRPAPPPRPADENPRATGTYSSQQWGEPHRQPEPARWAGQPPSPGPTTWSYVDAIRSSELVPTRKIPPRAGWRRALMAGTFGLINLGQSPDERRLAELESKIRSLLRGRYKIGVLGKGGTGKTTVAAAVGSIFAELRSDDRVVAIDADTAFGKLGPRIDPNAKGSYWELAADEYLDTFADVRSRVGNNAAGLFVLAGESATARRRVLDPAMYREATARLDNHFTISLIDCGSTMDSAVTQEALRDLDALIVVSSPWVDGASAAGQTMEWLAHHGYTGLLHRTVVVLNDSDGHADKRTRELLVDQFSQRGQPVIDVPFDTHLRPGGVVNVHSEINKTTRRRLIEIAAAIAEHFPTTTDRPRERR